MDVVTLKLVADQLRKPDGAMGIEIGLRMNQSNRYMNRFAIEALDLQNGDNILEVGMGNGEFVEQIVSHAPSITYTGLDYSQTMIDESSKRNEEHIRSGSVKFELGTADTLPFADNSFDKIVTVNTIYFWDPAKELAELRRVLKPEGKCIICIRPKAIMNNLPFTEYGFTLYTSDELSDVLADNSFAVVRIEQLKEPEYELDGEIKKLESVVAIAQPKK